jgi:hypothetical protein
MNWFVTWNVPEYKEWAQKTNYGYLLLVINKENSGYRCAKAKLIFKNNGLPEFSLLEEIVVNTVNEAERQIKEWKS